MTGRLAITLLLCFEQLSTLFSLLHFFFFPNTFSCKHLFFPNTSNILSTCSHSLFHKFSLCSGLFVFHAFTLFSLTQSFSSTFFYTLLFSSLFPFSVSTSILQSSLSSSFSFITYLPNLSLSLIIN